MDISSLLQGKSDQLDNTDLIGGPRDFTITGVTQGNVEQPLNISLAEFDRPWRPGLTMRRLLAAIWGVDAKVYVGRRVRLYRDPDVMFGRDKPGGTRMSHASHLSKAVSVTLPVSRGKVAVFTVEPLPDVPTLTDAQIAGCDDVAQLKAWWREFTAQRPVIEARVAEIQASAQGELGADS